MALDDDKGVAVDERPMVKPPLPVADPEALDAWAEADDEADDAELADDEDDLTEEEPADEAEDSAEDAEEDDEDDGFEEREPFAEGGTDTAEQPPVEREPTLSLDGTVYARIAECLRTAITEADERLGRARELAAREPFYTGFVTVLEAQRRRYVAALERALPLASAVAPATGTDEATGADDEASPEAGAMAEAEPTPETEPAI